MNEIFPKRNKPLRNPYNLTEKYKYCLKIKIFEKKKLKKKLKIN